MRRSTNDDEGESITVADVVAGRVMGDLSISCA